MCSYTVIHRQQAQTTRTFILLAQKAVCQVIIVVRFYYNLMGSSCINVTLSLSICQNRLLNAIVFWKQLLSTRTGKSTPWWEKSFSGCHSWGDWLGSGNASRLILGLVTRVYTVVKRTVVKRTQPNTPEVCILLHLIYPTVFKK